MEFKSKAKRRAMYAEDHKQAQSFEKKQKMSSRLPIKLKKKFDKKKLR